MSHLTYSKASAQALAAEAAGTRGGQCPEGGRRGCQSLHPTAQFSFQGVVRDLQPYSWDWHSGLSLSSSRRVIKEHVFKQSCLCCLKAAPRLRPTGNAMSQQRRSQPNPFSHHCPKQKLWSQQSFQRGQWLVIIFQPSQSTICSTSILQREKGRSL